MIEGELGAFIRSRREAVRPADVGLPAGSRRRTPGLRRSELATLAGVSVDYLIRLEQGRDTHPSTQVLAALADALRLDEDDLTHLRGMSVVSNGTELCPHARAAARLIRPPVRAMLDRFEPTPAVVINHRSDLLAWNDSYDRLARPVGVLDTDEPNLLRFVFTDERAHAAYPDWSDVADGHIADLQAALRGPDDDGRVLAARLVAEGGPEFAERWAKGAVARRRSGVEAMAHPEVGLLRLAFETLTLPDPDRQRLVVYLPADAATASGLDRLAGRQPGALRSMNAG